MAAKNIEKMNKIQLAKLRRYLRRRNTVAKSNVAELFVVGSSRAPWWPEKNKVYKEKGCRVDKEKFAS